MPPDTGAGSLSAGALAGTNWTRPLVSIAEGMFILLPSLCMLLPSGLCAKAVLLRAPRMPLPLPKSAFLLGLVASGSLLRGTLACSCRKCQSN